ncbi:hypothetical protein [Micromonospora sp. NPDC047730]|uniref:hypothetical protein n=1 Tax=Micromonospora sp. NPDC047730 TaxID=3364253 RepID=UPI0037158D40
MNLNDYDSRDDVAALIADPPLQPQAITNYMIRSRPGGRYASDPFPPPTAYYSRGKVEAIDPETFYTAKDRPNRRGKTPLWHHKLRSEIREWHARVLGGGRPGARKSATGGERQ